MVEVIPERLRKTWEIWNIRGVILVSLLLQTILFLGAPMRKRTGNRLVILLVWSSYFLAEWAASFALGLITSTQSSKHGENSDLYAFWASFLLLHHGGPDTITAFEENEVWLRHLVSLINQVGFTLYVLLQTLPKNNLWLPTSLIFFSGIIKYAERTRSLYLISWGTFRESMLTEPDAGPDYVRFMQVFSSKKLAKLPTTMSQTVDAKIKESKSAFYSSPPRENEALDDFEVVKYGYYFFKIFKGLIVDLVSYKDLEESKVFFYQRSPEDALKVLEVELNFIYKILYTKVFVVHTLGGCFFRLLTFALVLVSLGIFFFLDCKNGLDNFDIRVTYTLLLGALSLEAIAIFKLIFSDWTVASLDKLKSRLNLITYFLKQLPKNSHGENDQFCLGIYNKTTHLLHRIRRIGGKNVDKPLDAWDFLDELKYTSANPFTKKLWNFIFDELLWKSKEADNPEKIKTIRSARGAYVLKECMRKELGGDLVLFESLKIDYIENVTFDESRLLWHIATELCYCGSEVDHETKVNDHKFICKRLSDYMLYLLVMKPTMMSNVAGIGDIRYKDTCAEAKRFFRKMRLGPKNKEKDACENLLAVNTDVKPIYVKGDKSKSVLFDACILAKELQKLEGNKKWEVIN
ncbi:hypothetical protein I3842_15G051400 [Carya illinoinensis]|uniref:DUF4220 domain-containing protein n=1 Tax=Carya illinoinensis TaxID=32201 RepID=A0A922AAN5_CARIL|nr:hypothetical protein I3842_15G051400 [Carya illinoinensis]